VSPKEQAVSFMKHHQAFVLACHLNPDGDALGSALALSLALETMGKEGIVYSRDGVPETYAFLPESEGVKARIEQDVAGRAALVLIDCNSPERAGVDGASFQGTLVIDHHETERDFGDVRWVDSAEPATGLMVYRLLRDLGVPLSRDMAVNLYTAVAVDTGTFRFPNTTPDTLGAAADFVASGAEPGWVAERLYQTWSPGRFRLLEKTLGTVALHANLSMSAITREMFEETGTEGKDTENFVNFPLLMRDVLVSVIMREVTRGQWRVSFRSKGENNVARIAEEFGGGGHQNAAGCTMKGTLAAIEEKVHAAVKKHTGIG
jgi:phosphoesterase RecJ-like protein